MTTYGVDSLSMLILGKDPRWLIVRKLAVPLASALIGALVDAALLDRAVGNALIEFVRAVSGSS